MYPCLLALVVIHPSHAQDAVPDPARRTVGDLLAVCELGENSPSSWCNTYLMGIADTLTVFGNGGSKGGICRASYGIEELSAVYAEWAQVNRHLLGQDMLAGAIMAFQKRWPCS